MTTLADMELKIALADRIDPVAIYAAVVATFALGWQIFLWLRSGARLTGYANGNMKTFGMGNDEGTYVTMTVANVGNQPTTVTHVAVFSFDSWWRRLRDKPSKTFINNHSVAAYPIPYVLKAGETFFSMCKQDAELEQLSRDTLLYGVIIHSSSKRPLLLRIASIPPLPTSLSEKEKR